LKKGNFTYNDLDPGDIRNPMMCRRNSQITSDCDQKMLRKCSFMLLQSLTQPRLIIKAGYKQIHKIY
jgi:hypothetical protein